MTDIERVLLNGSIAEIGALYRSHRTSVVEAVAWYLTRIERFKDLNAVRDISEHARADAKRADHELLARGIDHGPLHGIPVLLKDNILARGLRASAGLGRSPSSSRAVMPPWRPSCAPPAPLCWARPT